MSILHSKEYKVVYDCSSSDAQYIKSRMWLVGKTMDMIKEQGDTSQVVLALHGGCVPMVSKSYDWIVADEDVQNIKQAQDYLKSLSKRKNVKIIVCAMSLNSNAIEKKEVLPFIQIVKNSFIDTIYYQNLGYALMTFK
ncbi:MAG: DsrE family protein [Sulfurovum sp.]|nr:DsrE family protein [Sulfurovum sp.]